MMLGLEETHKPADIVVIILTWVIYLASTIIIVLAEFMPSVVGMEQSTTTMLSVNDMGLNPATWSTYTLWCLSLVVTLLWLSYALSTLCRFTVYGFLYIAPGHMHVGIYVLFTLALMSAVIWTFLLGASRISWALIPAVIGTLCFFAALCFSLHRLYRRGAVLQREDAIGEIWAVRILVHNGVGIIGTCFFYLSMLNVNMVLVYELDVAPHISTTIVISVTTLVLLAIFFVDILLCDRLSRYCLGIYLVFFVALLGSTFESWNTLTSNSVFLAFASITAGLCLLVKLTLAIYRHGRKPIWGGGRLYVPYQTYGSLGNGNAKCSGL